MMEEHAKREIGEWIVSATLAGANEVAILAGVGERLNAAGVSLVRVSVATDLLDPTFDGRGVRWLREEGGVEETFVRDADGIIVNQDFPQSPFGFLLRSGQPTLRRRLDATYRRGEFPMLDKFQDQGFTDYVAFAVRVGETIRLGVGEGIAASWTTDAPGGFTDAEVELLAGIMPPLTLAIMLRTTHRDTRTLLTTYLGRHAADRVLAGNIVRGRAEPIQRRRLVQRPRRLHADFRQRECRQGAGAPERLCPGAGRGDRGARGTRAEVHRRRHPRDLPRCRHDASPARARSMPRPGCDTASPR